jgi:hypothetical protein
MPTLTVCDETPVGDRKNLRDLDFLNERVTVRELIRERVYEEVREYNAARLGAVFNGLVQPTETEATLNGYRFRDGQRRQINWEAQYERAIRAFENNGFFLLVDDKQAESLDDEIQIRPGMTVSFLRLVPLVGG